MPTAWRSHSRIILGVDLFIPCEENSPQPALMKN